MQKVSTKRTAVKDFNRLAEPVEEKVYRLALLATSSAALASQIASEALVQVYIRLADEAPANDDLPAWISQAAMHECLRLLRKERQAAVRATLLARHAS